MNLTNEERQALIGFCKTTLRLKDSEGMGYKLAEFALAALTAEPVAYGYAEGLFETGGKISLHATRHYNVPLYAAPPVPPAPLVVKLPKKYGLGLVFSTEEVIAAICAAGGEVADDDLDAKRRAFIDSLQDDTAPQQYEYLSTEAALKMGMERYGAAMKKLADKGDK